ncbi:MAG: 30S ribosomal protein S17 [Planctomycetes bacterium]|nr:30S ribosomal protein S17 [Planctomycetota bacterium]
MSTNQPSSGDAPAQRSPRKLMRGMVISNKMAKTIVVQVDRKVRHPVYEKFVSKRTKLYAHDEKSEAGMGDVVELCQTRPLSKTKCWRLVRVVQKARQ